MRRLASAHPVVRLVDLPRRRSRRAHWGRPPAPHAVRGFTWDLLDRRSPHWWPQGIDVLPADGPRPDLLVVSWFSRRGRASRVSFVEPRASAPRYWHVALVAAGEVGWAPVTAHAGGVAVAGDHLYVAGTHGGLHEFRLDGMLEIDGALALPRSAELVPRRTAAGRLRYSFVSVARRSGRPELVVGEWRPEHGGRLARLAPDGDAPFDGGEIHDLHDPGIPRMQGALADGDTWFVTSGNGHRRNGDLWVGERGGLVRLPGELGSGPEDLTSWGDELWTLSEFPGRRWVYALDRDDVLRRASAAEPHPT